MERQPHVAGQFYPASARKLKETIASLTPKRHDKITAIGCVLPHAGYIYSGSVAGATISRLNMPQTLFILGPNHTGIGSPFSIMTEGSWLTPLGKLNIDSGLAKAVLNGCQLLKENSIAHSEEHSIEVELPFFQYFREDIKIVPITILSGNINQLNELGDALARGIDSCAAKEKVLVAASSDMTHYEPLPDAERKDRQAIEAILALDELRLAKEVKRLDISMCGLAPVTVMLRAAKALGAKKGELIKYATSAEASGDASSVVGYAGIVIY